MPTETVTIAFVNEPKPGKKYGSIKSEAGDYYSVKPDQLALFKKGGTYEIQYGLDKTNTYRNFERIVGASPANAAKGDHNQSTEMAMMGAVGRWLEGAGGAGVPFPDEDILTDMFCAVKNAWERAFAAKKPAEFDDAVPF